MNLVALREVLDRAADQGWTIDLWWRDDDAVAHTPPLDRLLSLASQVGLPPAIAAIPSLVETSLQDRLCGVSGVAVLVHGFRHLNAAAAGSKPTEFGADRDDGDMAEDARIGLAELEQRFGESMLPVFVPPWNRIAPSFAARLSALGYEGLSVFGTQQGPSTARFRTVNTHLDPVDWRGSRSLSAPSTLAAVLDRAVQTSSGPKNAGPIGLLTHHLVFDERLWAFCTEFLDMCATHRAIRFVTASNVWPRETLSSNCAGMRVKLDRVSAGASS